MSLAKLSCHYLELILKVFSAHPYGGASLSSAYNKRVSERYFLKAEDWTNAGTFLNHYYAHASKIPVGQIILNESSLEG